MKSQTYKHTLIKLFQRHRFAAKLRINSKYYARINTHTKQLAHQNTIPLTYDYTIQIQLNGSHPHIHQNSFQAQLIQEILIRIILRSFSLTTVSHYKQNCVSINHYSHNKPTVTQEILSKENTTQIRVRHPMFILSKLYF
jgi:hypothetical protein